MNYTEKLAWRLEKAEQQRFAAVCYQLRLWQAGYQNDQSEIIAGHDLKIKEIKTQIQEDKKWIVKN